jgi:SpoIVB peptidase S55
MMSATRPILLLSPPLLAVALACCTAAEPPAQTGPHIDSCWQVDDVRAGMKGHGRTVMKGTKIEDFQAEVLGVLKNTSPGRDMVLCRLSGLNLDKTGVIAGMSGSPVYIDNKLLGAVAYAWAYGKEPIAGVTPFCQMHSFVEAFERRDLAEQGKPTRVGLRQPLRVGDREFSTVTVSHDFDDPEPRNADGMWMVPLRTPLAATGFTPHSLKLLRDRCGTTWGLLPMQGGGTTARIADEEKDTKLEPGGPLAIAMITGDFDLSGIGTVTHIEGKRVYGWGHPFMSLGTCEFPLMTGYIHTIYPRQTVSFKMGSPLKTVGVINADVSTGIAGWLDRKPDMMPLRMTVQLGKHAKPKTFQVQVARQRSLLASLVFTALTNSIDMEGELPEELTAEMSTRIELEGHAPLVLKDTFSGFSGGRAPQALYSQVGAVINLLAFNSYESLRIVRIDCETRILPDRRAAEIEAMELDSDTWSPGDTLKGTVFVRPFKGAPQRVPVSLKLPTDLPEGNYTVTACDDLYNARQTLRANPVLNNPLSVEQVLEALQVHLTARRTSVALRIPVEAAGVAVDGKALPNLPASMVQILGNSKRTGAQTMSGALVSRHPTEWVIQGSEGVRITVTKNHRVLRSSE